jgi:hypothetical protein
MFLVIKDNGRTNHLEGSDNCGGGGGDDITSVFWSLPRTSYTDWPISKKGTVGLNR